MPDVQGDVNEILDPTQLGIFIRTNRGTFHLSSFSDNDSIILLNLIGTGGKTVAPVTSRTRFDKCDFITLTRCY